MADKQDIPMSAFKLFTDAAYLYGEAADSSQGKITKEILFSSVEGLCFKGHMAPESYTTTIAGGFYSHGGALFPGGTWGVLFVINAGSYNIHLDFLLSGVVWMRTMNVGGVISDWRIISK